jgi:predicted GNAT family N-acyltransferase
VKLEHFSIEVADWSHERDRQALLDIRAQVFIVEQGVPEQRERDELDASCWHLLARDDDGQPIGCARLTPRHSIGRMAVLAGWRGRGVGAALLREMLARASSQGWPQVTLSAQVGALGFYERAGFQAAGAVYEDAGLLHRSMHKPLSTTPGTTLDRPLEQPQPGMLPATTRADIADARLQLLADARHRVSIYAPQLDGEQYASSAELDELRRIATSGRSAQIRILLHDPAAALRNDHRLIALAQRLSSIVSIRTPVEEVDLADTSAYLLNDGGGYLLLPDAQRPPGRAARQDRAAQAPLQQHFDAVWERSERASVLQTLNL